MKTSDEKRAYQAAYTAAHREKKQAYHAAWYAIHREEQRLKALAYNAAHREEQRVYFAAYRLAHLEEKRAQHVVYNAAHREEQRRYNAVYRVAHPENGHEYAHRRRARLRSQFVAPVDAAVIYARDRGRCHLCGKKVRQADASMDHIIPISLGGIHAPSNVRLAHLKCNLRRNTRGPAQLLLDGVLA